MSKALQAQKKDLARLTEEISARKASIGRDLYGIGMRLGRIQRERLWEAGSYRDFDDYLAHAVDISRRSAYRFIRIAEHFSTQIAARYGVTKLDAALRYLGATNADEQPGDLLAADVLVRMPNGRYQSIPLHEASATQIEQAARALEQSSTSRARGRIPRQWRSRAARLEEPLPSAPPGTGGGDRVRIKRARDGTLAVSFRAIPIDELDAFLEAVREELRSDG